MKAIAIDRERGKEQEDWKKIRRESKDDRWTTIRWRRSQGLGLFYTHRRRRKAGRLDSQAEEVGGMREASDGEDVDAWRKMWDHLLFCIYQRPRVVDQVVVALSTLFLAISVNYLCFDSFLFPFSGKNVSVSFS